MRTLLCVIFLAMVCLTAHGQQPPFYYQSCIDVPTYSDDGSNHNAIRNSIVRNTTGEMALVGNSKLYRFNKDGVKSWEKDLVSGVQDLEIDASGNVVAIHQHELYFDLGQAIHLGRAIVKYTAAGTKAWENTSSVVGFIDATVDKDGNVYASGYDSNAGELFFTKYNGTTGAALWSKTLTGYYGQSVVTSSTGDVYMLAFNGSGNYKLYKYSSAGTLQWQVDYNNNLYIGDLIMDPNNNLYMTIADYFSSRFVKVQTSNGNVLKDVLFDLGRIIVAFRGSDFVIVGQNFNSDYALVNYPGTFPTPTAADYIDTFNSFDIDYAYVYVGIESNGTAGIIYTKQDDGFGLKRGTLVRYDATGNKLNETMIETVAAGGVLDYTGDYVMPTSGRCMKRLTPCSKFSINITTPPQTQTVCPGSNVNFTVAATGLNLLYQWKKGTDLLANGGRISGANSATLTISNADNVNDAGSYSCVIYDDCGNSKTSTAATLGFIPGPAITGQPTPVEACAGSNISFTVTATGQNLKYQWKKGGTALVDNALVTGAKAATLNLKTISANDVGLYTCDVTSDCSATPISSQTASLTVYLPASVITPPPAMASACTGGDLTITLEASGANITYQWRKGTTNLVESATKVGTKTNTLTLKQLATGDVGDYSCVITGMCGAPATSSSTTVSIATASQITVQPVSKSVCSGTNVSFSITATGSNIIYTWRKGNTVINNGGKYGGATTATLSITGATAAEAGAYTCTISNPCGSEIASNAAQLNIDAAPGLVSQSGTTVLCEGDVGRLSVTTVAGNFQFQWKKDGVPLNDGSVVTGTTTDELLIISAAPSDGGTYTCEIKSGCGNPLTSTGIPVTVNRGTQIVSQTADVNTCQDDNMVLSVTATGNGLAYAWKKNGVLLSNAGTVSGAKTATLTVTHVSPLDEGRYTCEVTGTCKGTAVSEGIDVSVDPKPSLVLAADIDCKDFRSQWSQLVTDANNTQGEYTLFKKGSTTPLQLSDIDALGEYLIVKSTGACSDTVTWNNTCLITATEQSSSPRISVVPNPSNGSFKIMNLPRPLPFELYNAQGKLVLSAHKPGDDGSVDAGHLSDGLYLLAIPGENGKGETLRVVIRKEQ